MIYEGQRHSLSNLEILGRSTAMQAVQHLVKKASVSKFPVLLEGETGVGKGLVARLLHQLSEHKQQPFIRVNCAAIPRDLLESELFGHVKGAFSSAEQKRGGLFAAAGSGTLFLDELTELPLALQSKLLHVLDERVFRPVGSDKERPFHARVIAASNVGFAEAVDNGTFREDLYFRLDVMSIRIPPLRERISDIIPLAEYLLDIISEDLNAAVPALSPCQRLWLQKQAWRGNVRALKNTLERAIILGSSDTLLLPDMGHVEGGNMDGDNVQNLACASRVFEHDYIVQAIAQCDGDKGEAAKLLGIALSSLYRKLES